MVKTFLINSYFNKNNILETIYINFINYNIEWYMNIYKRVNNTEIRYENIKILDNITYDFIKEIIDNIREKKI